MRGLQIVMEAENFQSELFEIITRFFLLVFPGNAEAKNLKYLIIYTAWLSGNCNSQSDKVILTVSLPL